MDLSDGLSLDLARFCRESKVGAELSSIPIARGASLDEALDRGEDYELLFTAPPKLKIPPSLASDIGRDHALPKNLPRRPPALTEGL